MVGLAVDYPRWERARQTHAQVIDSALLAGARRLQADHRDAEGALAVADRTYKAVVADRMDTKDNSVAFTLADGGDAVTFEGDAFIPSVFLQMVGISKLSVTTPAKAVFGQSSINNGGNLELVAMLDVTGSMCDDRDGPCTTGAKISGLKAAMSDLASIVLGSNSSGYSARIALVPFARQVRLAPDGTLTPLMQTLTNMPPNWSGWYEECTSKTTSGTTSENSGSTCLTWTTYQATNWKLKPCVTERYNETTDTLDTTDELPSSNNWHNLYDGNREPSWEDSTDMPLSSQTGLSSADPSHQYNYKDNGSCNAIKPGNDILPLTSDLAAVKSRVDAMQAYGATSGALGTAWAYYLISPKWRNIWTGSSEPGDYADIKTIQPSGAPLLRKVAVLMTDGGYNAAHGDKNEDQQTVSDAAVAICNNMKANGIEIYTVGFAFSELTGDERTIAENTMKACATDTGQTYLIETVDQLKLAFKDIGVKQVPLHLSQ